MRFKKGTKVEVLSKAEVPSGSWLCAEVICGNAHCYTIRYDGYRGADGEAIVERVSVKAIRPCPPALELIENWCPGDVVEVFQNLSWKMATVLKVSGDKYIFVRLLGSSLEFKVSKFDIRVRQSWQEGKWIVVGEGSVNSENGKRDCALNPRQILISSAQIQKTATMTKLSASNVYNSQMKENTMLDSYLVSFKALKRRSHLQVEAYAEPPKFRAIENEGVFHRARVRNPPTLLKQVHDVSFPRDVLIEERVPTSVNKRKTDTYDMDMERKKQSGVVRCPFGENKKSDDVDSVTCSVGSCSITGRNSYNLQFPISASPSEDVYGSFSHAESFCQRGYEEGSCYPPTQEELEAKIHRYYNASPAFSRTEFEAYMCRSVASRSVLIVLVFATSLALDNISDRGS
ncbi:unnamed protein product [Lupinus luteus]|uniref:Agenet domain-containing protein n=1 Tax=Lupinus luteus TaxID=3873 RepID=A0AAV1WDW4_LUPLU